MGYKYKEDAYNSPDEVLESIREEEALDPEYEVGEEYEMSESDDDIIEMFDDHRAKMEGVWNPIYSEAEDDWDMYNLNQWTESGKRGRGRRPRLTVDITRKFVKSVVAETFRNPPGVKLTARTDSSSDKAKYISEAIRYFEARTGAIYSYSWAKECAAVCGIGWLKVTYRYDEQQAMPAVIDVDRVADPLSIMMDPDAKELDGSDALYAMEVHGTKEGAEKFTYWWKDEEGLVKWAIICGSKVEDKGEFPSRDIPLVPVYGEVYHIRNKIKCFGLIRQLKDTQRSYNYVISEAVERLALTPKSPIKSVEGAIPDRYMGDWMRSMTEPVPILFWNNKDEDGNITIPEPTRNDSTPDTAWVGPMMGQLQMTANETSGIYPDSYGAQNSAESGVAIKARMEGADRGQLVYDEHLQIAIKQVGSIMLDLLEPVVTPAGILPIMGEDGQTGTMMIGEETPVLDEMGNPTPIMDEIGRPVLDEIGQMIPAMNPPELPDLDVTDLEISIEAAPAYATRKQEGLDKVTEIMPMLTPDQQAKLAPQVLRELDFPGAEEYANILAPDLEKGPDPMMLQQQMEEMQAQLDQAMQVNEDIRNANTQLEMNLKQNTEATLAKAQIDSNTKLKIEEMRLQASFVELQYKIEADAMGDDKKIMSDQQSQHLDAQISVSSTASKNQIEMSKLAQSTKKDNADIALSVQKQQQDMLSKIEVQPVAVVDRTEGTL